MFSSGRRRARRNPALGFSPRSLVRTAIQGVTDAGGILAGEAIAGLAETHIPGVTAGTTKGAAAAAVVSVAGGVAAMKFVNRRTGEMIVAGGIAKLARRWVKAQNWPTISAALGDYGLPLVSSYDQLAGYQPPVGYVTAGAQNGAGAEEGSLEEIYGYAP